MKKGRKETEGVARGQSSLPLLDGAVRVCLYAILATPLLVWSGFLFPHVTPKVLAFEIFVELAWLFILLRAIVGKVPSRLDSRYLGPVFVSLVIFQVYSLVASALGKDWTRSLWGFIDRQDGLVLQFHFVAWAGALVWALAGGRKVGSSPETPPAAGNRAPAGRSDGWVRYFVFSFWVCVVFSLQGLWQGGFLRSVHIVALLRRVILDSNRPGGLFGNPQAAGPYLLFHLFAGWYYLRLAAGGRAPGNPALGLARKSDVLLRTSRSLHVFGVLVGLLLILLFLLAGQTRGVIFGGLAGVLGIALWNSLSPKATPRTRIVGALILLAVAVSAIALWRYRQAGIIANNPLLGRLTRILPQESDTTLNRLLTWRSALKAVGDQPLFGWGVDNQYYALNLYYDPQHVRFTRNFSERTLTWYDKAHNFFLDLLVERGLIGFVLYLGLLAAMVRALWRLPERSLASALVGVLAACLASNLVGLDTFGSFLASYFAAACLAISEAGDGSFARFRRTETRRERREGRGRTGFRGRILGRVTLAAALGLCILLVFLNVQIGLANHSYWRAVGLFQSDPAAGIAAHLRAFDYFSPYHPGQMVKCAYAIVDSVVQRRAVSQNMEVGPILTRLSREAIAAHPDDLDTYILLNDMYNKLALTLDPRFAEQAEHYGMKALALSPRRQEAIFTLARTYIIRNQAAKAVELNRRMVADYPDFGTGRWFLGLALLADGRKGEAMVEIENAFRLGYRFQNAEEEKMIREHLGQGEIDRLARPR